MNNSSTGKREERKEETMGIIDAIVRTGAQKILQATLEEEISEFIERYQGKRDDRGR